ncbi:MAG: LuxR C-terminal-related transcriptional regulator [Gemmobacter sp.]
MGAGAAPPATAANVADASGQSLRERGILHLISAGRTNKQIGLALALTENTVKFHVRNIFGKLQVNTRTAAIAAARHLGLLHEMFSPGIWWSGFEVNLSVSGVRCLQTNA